MNAVLVVALGVVGALASGFALRGPSSRRRRARSALLFLLAFLPWFGLAKLDINMLSHELYRGDSRGLEVTLVDLIAITLYIALPRARYGLPYRVGAFIYLSACVFSITLADIPLYATFGAWKALRCYFVGVVVVRACTNLSAAAMLLRGHCWGILWTTGIALKQRYLEHLFQVSGTFEHQNSLGMAINLVAPVILALVLARRGGWLTIAALGCSAGCIVMTLSRGAILVFPLALGGVFALSLAKKVTGRKLAMGVAGAAGATVVLIKALDTIMVRFKTAPKESAEGRERFEEAASLMFEDHPFGIGINQYSHALENLGYAEQTGIGVKDAGGIVHNIYWLTLAELGVVGLLGYLIVIGVPLVLALRWAWRGRHDLRGDVLIGCSAGFTAMYLQGMLEWIARQTVMSYFFWMQAALVLALVRQLREQERAARRQEPSGSEAGKRVRAPHAAR